MEIHWPLVVFTLCVCAGAGTIVLQGFLCVLGKGEKTQVSAAIFSLAALVVGGIASFLHLHHWDRAFNGLANLSSGIAQELISIGVLIVVLVVFLVTGRKSLAPKWVGIFSILAGLAVVFFTTMSYVMPARPIWSSPMLYLFYYGQAFVGGATALWLLSSLVGEKETAGLMVKCAAIAGIVVAVSMLAYPVVASSVSFSDLGNYWDTTIPTAPLIDTTNLGGELLVGNFAVLFWVGVIAGAVIPALLGFLKFKEEVANAPFAGFALLSAFGGGFAFRAVIYLLGISVFALF